MKLLLIDGNSLLNRAFYAMPLLSTPDGRYTNAVYGFTNMLLSAIEQIQPTHAAVAFDRREPTFRHKEYALYKQGRKPMPDELAEQFPLLREVLECMNVSTIDLAGYEADDLIGTLSRICECSDGECVILSGDKDNLQLVSNATSVWITRKGISQTEKFSPSYLSETMGLTPEQIIDYKALAGDTSDNIPGIPGVGEKTALKLLYEYKTVESILEHSDSVKGKLGERIRENKDSAVLSKRLATINRFVPITFTMEDCIYRAPDTSALRKLFTELEFKSLLAKLPEAQQEEQTLKDDFVPPVTREESEVTSDMLRSSFPKKVVALYFSSEESAIYIAQDKQTQLRIPIMLNFAFEGMPPDLLYPILEQFLKDKAVISYDCKSLMHELGFRFELEGDIMVAEYLLDSLKGSYPLEDILSKYDLPPCASALLHINELEKNALASQGMTSLYTDIELPLTSVLYDMELCGFNVDCTILKKLGVIFGERLDELCRTIYDLAGETFNINSPKQLGEILFEKLGLPHGRKTKTGYSTNIEVLQSLENCHAIISPIMEYRQLQKLKSTYIDAMVVLPDSSGRIHSSFNQTVTATGRISSTEPNLQNIPVRTELGRHIRKAFTAKEGCVLIDGDYSQIELRVLAHLANDDTLKNAFLNNEDIHTATAASVFDVPVHQVTKEQRSAAKAVNFGIVYGISDYGLSQNIGVSVREAGKYIKDYLDKFPGVRAFMDRAKAEAKLNGFACTMMGRRRPCPELTSSNYNTRSFGERVAMNTPVQGSAADIIKLAMVKVSRALKESGLRTRLILQVHDELLLEAPINEQEQAAALLKKCMQECCALSVPLTVDCNTGTSWYETK